MSEPSLFKLRVEYVKHGRLRYLGHLEVLRTVERSIRRAGLPYAVTQGFSPHMRIAFSSALPTGTSSDAEYYDLYLTAYVPADEALRALVSATPVDLAPRDAAYVDLRADSPTAMLTRARYRVDLRAAGGGALPSGPAEEALARTAALESIEYLRGKKAKRMDVARTLVEARLETRGDRSALLLDTRSSNEGALRPEVFVRAYARELAALLGAEDADQVLAGFTIARISQHGEDEHGMLVSPMPERSERSVPRRASAENM